MQRDHYLPLKVIREHLEAMERGEAVQLPVVGVQGFLAPVLLASSCCPPCPGSRPSRA